MAITKIKAINSRLDNHISYVANEKKTLLNGTIEYVVNHDKTEQRLYESVINCSSADNAYTEMISTKSQWNKISGRQGYHIIQSFAPGETTPDEAHKIGIELVRRLFGGKYEAVIGTHLNTDNLHNHIIINSVSCLDGVKCHFGKDAVNRIREVSDRLCREHDLSVIVNPKGRGKPYSEYMAEKQGKRTWRDAIREDIDEVISVCRAPSQFFPYLRKMGYEVKDDVKYIAIRPPKKERFVRLKSLGTEYEWQRIKARVFEQKTVKALPERKPKNYRAYHIHGTFPKKKLKGFRALYFHYLYKMGILPKNRTPVKRASFALREDLYKLEKINAETKLLCNHKIDTFEQLAAYKSSIEARMATITTERKDLRNKVKSAKRSGGNAEHITVEISDLSGQLALLRKEVRLCDGIKARSEEIPKKLHQAKQEEKELMKNEYKRGRGRPGR